MTEIVEISNNGMHWYGKALEYKQMHEMAVRREGDLEAELQRRTTEREYHKRMADKLSEVINAQKVELASRNLRILGLEETLKDAERFLSYFANETGGHFVGDGTPTTCLARIRRVLGNQ